MGRKREEEEEMADQGMLGWEPGPCRDWGKATLTQALGHHHRVHGTGGRDARRRLRSYSPWTSCVTLGTSLHLSVLP